MFDRCPHRLRRKEDLKGAFETPAAFSSSRSQQLVECQQRVHSFVPEALNDEKGSQRGQGSSQRYCRFIGAIFFRQFWSSVPPPEARGGVTPTPVQVNDDRGTETQ